MNDHSPSTDSCRSSGRRLASSFGRCHPRAARRCPTPSRNAGGVGRAHLRSVGIHADRIGSASHDRGPMSTPSIVDDRRSRRRCRSPATSCSARHRISTTIRYGQLVETGVVVTVNTDGTRVASQIDARREPGISHAHLLEPRARAIMDAAISHRRRRVVRATGIGRALNRDRRRSLADGSAVDRQRRGTSRLRRARARAPARRSAGRRAGAERHRHRGCPVRFTGTVHTSHRYIASGSAVLAPSSNATVGDVGDSSTSNCSYARSKSRMISVRTRCACP